MNRKLILAATALAASFSTPALAQSAVAVRPYVGVLAGLDNVELEALGESDSKGDLMYGALAGVEFGVSPNVFLGIEAEINDSKVSDSAEDVLVAGDEVRASVGREIFVGGRIGFRATPNVSVYGLGGYSNVRAKARYSDPASSFSASGNLDGFRLGAGVEFGVGPVRLRGEYRHAEYEDFGVPGLDVDSRRDQFVAAAVIGF